MLRKYYYKPAVVDTIQWGMILVEFKHYDSGLHKEAFIQLNIAYITWIADQVMNRYGFDFDETMGVSIEEYCESKCDEFSSISSADGVLFILEYKDKVIGMGALHRYDSESGEIKRMYIKPEFRGRGFGKQLLKNLVEAGREAGYSALRLDTGGFMDTAQHVYASVGFKKIPEYTKSEVPIPLRHHWMYMELKL
jgi:N-acetylglutamate synthase-like GNAT family acetyltransferase